MAAISFLETFCICYLMVLLYFSVYKVAAVADLDHPKYQWPMSQLTNAYDTTNRVDGLHPTIGECPPLALGPPLMISPFYAYWFEVGTTTYAQIPTVSLSAGVFDSFSVSMYVYPEILDGVILNYKATSSEAIRITSFCIKITYSRINVMFYDADDKVILGGKSSNALLLNEWNLVVVVRDKANDKMTIRVNDIIYTVASGSINASQGAGSSVGGNDSDDETGSDGGDDGSDTETESESDVETDSDDDVPDDEASDGDPATNSETSSDQASNVDGNINASQGAGSSVGGNDSDDETGGDGGDDGSDTETESDVETDSDDDVPDDEASDGDPATNSETSSDQASNVDVSQYGFLNEGRILIAQAVPPNLTSFRGRVCCLAIYDDIIDLNASTLDILHSFINTSALVGDLSGVATDCAVEGLTTTTAITTTSTTSDTTTATITSTSSTAADAGCETPSCTSVTTPRITYNYPIKQLWPLCPMTDAYGMIGPSSPIFPAYFECFRNKHVCSDTAEDAIYFDGSQLTLVDFNVTDSLMEGDLTLSLFLLAEEPGEGILIDYKSSPLKLSGIKGFHLYFENGVLSIRIWDGNGVCGELMSSGLVKNNWSFVYIYRKISTKVTSIFVDGARTMVTDSCQTAHLGLAQSEGTLRIGRGYDQPVNTVGFHGSISCVTIFDDIVGRTVIKDATIERCQTLAAEFILSASCNNTQPPIKFRRFKMVATDMRPGHAGLPAPMAQYNVTSLLDCSQECSTLPYCRSFSYNDDDQAQNRCKVYDFVTNYLLTHDVGYIYCEIVPAV